MEKTLQQYNVELDICRELFYKKTKDYGTAWRILRPSSITDQIFIKAQRIRTLEDKKVSKVGEDIIGEYIGIINYCVIAMMQLEISESAPQELNADEVGVDFDVKVNEAKELMFA